MIHLVEHLNVKSVVINGFHTAELEEEQTTACGLKIKVKSHEDFCMRKDIGRMECADCRKYFQKLISRPFDCEHCHKVLDNEDIEDLKPKDTERLCILCKIKK